MNADNWDNMVRIKAITLQDWKDTVTPHESWLWFHDLVMLIERSHFELDRAHVGVVGPYNEMCLHTRIGWLRERVEEAEDDDLSSGKATELYREAVEEHSRAIGRADNTFRKLARAFVARERAANAKKGES